MPKSLRVSKVQKSTMKKLLLLLLVAVTCLGANAQVYWGAPIIQFSGKSGSTHSDSHLTSFCTPNSSSVNAINWSVDLKKSNVAITKVKIWCDLSSSMVTIYNFSGSIKKDWSRKGTYVFKAVNPEEENALFFEVYFADGTMEQDWYNITWPIL